MREFVALLTLVALLPACGGGPPVVTNPNAARVQWEVELHTPKPEDPEEYNKQDALLILDREAGELHAGGRTMKLDGIQEASYSFAKKPRWGLAILAWPLLFLKKKKHWLALSDDTDNIWVVKMENRNYSNIISSLEREGVEVKEYTEEG